ncbi:hypothetical protein P154DRAFT_614499 [Amniculicola lignicola CBS 123094]|uniref:Uncharacterized protein n=1 Tax=Amniculicola lignicola CBS 123094 TaxID=1392246 RepID=A0A6A5X5L2_9PLEO|nr:hypothetical protein P154DRAFT_614499 [Amniculicola lignicola CBS 123094]
MLSSLLLSTLLTSFLPTTLSSPHGRPEPEPFPQAQAPLPYPRTYTGSFYGYGYISVINAKSRASLGCLSDDAKLIVNLPGECAEYYLSDSQFSVLDTVTDESKGLVSFENAGAKQPDTKDIFWIYDSENAGLVTDFWMQNGLITANDEQNDRKNVSTFYVADTPKPGLAFNVTTVEQKVPISWIWRPNCDRTDKKTKWCNGEV